MLFDFFECYEREVKKAKKNQFALHLFLYTLKIDF